MSQEKIDWDKVTVEGQETGAQLAESAEGATIEVQIEKVREEIEANSVVLKGNIDRLPEPETISVDEYPGLREHLERYKEKILESREDKWSHIGIMSGVLGGVVGGAAAAEGMLAGITPGIESGLTQFAGTLAIGLLIAGADQVIAKVSAYLKTKKHEKEILAGETN